MGDVWVYNYRASDAPSADHEDDTFELIPGAKLFCEASYTMLNVTPLEDHQALALLGFKPSAEPPFDIEELTLRLLHSRGVALIRNANRDELALASLVQQGIDPQPEQYSFIDGIVFDDTRLPLHPGGFAYRFMGMVGKEWIPITRVFSRGAEGWNVTDYSEWPLPGEENRAKKLSSKQLPLEAVQVYCRGLDVLYQSQRSYRALDRMFSLTLRQLGGVNAKTIISGYLGNNQQASDELHREDRDVALFPGNATVNRVGTTAAIDQLRSSFEA
ncbi:MAG TPA: hypothetical protein VD932_02235, partial [Aquabacterium sp.]|nr:hypothetical protein [Aquabacterium sp.]